jgi:translation initiation factor 2 gamma subunit (eIF-2gamma)
MGTQAILVGIDEELQRLRQARELLLGAGSAKAVGGVKKKRHHVMSAEGRARIAAAQRARWAKQKRAAKKAA